MFEHPARDLRLVGGKAEDDRRRRMLAEGKRAGERLAHQRRGIVQQHDQRAFGGGAVIGREIGIEISACQRGGGFGPFGGAGATQPL